jgi:hypothetical protein
MRNRFTMVESQEYQVPMRGDQACVQRKPPTSFERGADTMLPQEELLPIYG